MGSNSRPLGDALCRRQLAAKEAEAADAAASLAAVEERVAAATAHYDKALQRLADDRAALAAETAERDAAQAELEAEAAATAEAAAEAREEQQLLEQHVGLFEGVFIGQIALLHVASCGCLHEVQAHLCGHRVRSQIRVHAQDPASRWALRTCSAPHMHLQHQPCCCSCTGRVLKQWQTIVRTDCAGGRGTGGCGRFHGAGGADARAGGGGAATGRPAVAAARHRAGCRRRLAGADWLVSSGTVPFEALW